MTPVPTSVALTAAVKRCMAASISVYVLGRLVHLLMIATETMLRTIFVDTAIYYSFVCDESC